MRLLLKLFLSYLVIISASFMIARAAIKSAEDNRHIYKMVYGGEIPHAFALKDLGTASVRIVASSMEYAFLSAMGPAAQENGGRPDLEDEKQVEKSLIAKGKADFLKSLAQCKEVIQLHDPNERDFPVIYQAGMTLLALSDDYIRQVDRKASREELLEAKEAFEEAEQAFIKVLAASHDREMSNLDGHVKGSLEMMSGATASARLYSYIAIAGSLLLGLALSISIVRRIRLLDAAAREVAAGSRETRLPVTCHDEITSVSISFNLMVEKLRDSEKTLDSTNRYLDSIIATMPEALTVVSTDGSILDSNRATVDILGIEGRDLAGRQFADFFQPREEGVEFINSVIAGSAVVEREAVLLTKEGKEINVSLSARMLESNGVNDRFLCLSNDITRRKTAEQEVHKLAYFDQLTGLANRTLFFDRCSQSLAHARRHGKLFAILFFDLDHFKDVNDTMGHHCGDRLLQLVVRRLQCMVRESDTFARLGGDEFALLCTSISSPEAAAKVAEKLLALLAEPFEIDNRQIYSGASVGIVIFPGDGGDVRALLKNADLAMYAAKSAGGKRFQFFSDELNQKAQERADLELALREALRRNELTVHYQPQVDIESGRVTGMEALARWNHAGLGMVPPERFIPVAEQSGLIKELGEWVLKTASLECRKWHQQGHEIIVSVNVSIMQLMHKEFPETVVRTLLEAGLEPRYLDLELTESLLMENASQAVGLLKMFKSLGVRISIDDFGTGYSALSYLKNFSVDRIKIDKSFIRDITFRADAAGIVKAIVAIGHSMGLTVIAEGVESRKEEEKLIQCGCDEIQGYYYGKPMPAAEVEAYLSRQNHGAGGPSKSIANARITL